MYEVKLLSYLRIDILFIIENEFVYLKVNFGKYSGFLGFDFEMLLLLIMICLNNSI